MSSGRTCCRRAVTDPPSRFATFASLDVDKDSSLFEIVETFERRTIIERLEQTGWSQTEAAKSFHMRLSTLNQKIKRHGINSKKKREKSTA